MVKKMTMQGTILKWGNSYGIRISKEMVEKMKLQEKERVNLEVKPIQNPLKELWGTGKDNPISKETIRKLAKELEGDWI